MLREIPAVELKRQSSLVDGSAQIVSIRGVDEGRTVVLFDGIPVSDAWGEWIDWGRVPKGHARSGRGRRGRHVEPVWQWRHGRIDLLLFPPTRAGSATVTVDAAAANPSTRSSRRRSDLMEP
jgi:hypothetical protein